MQRVRVLGGRLKARQWRVLGELADRFTPAAPLHLTTRQDLEFHDLTASAIPQLQAALAEAGLSGAGACGDTARNITICPCAGTGDRPELWQLAQAILSAMQAHPQMWYLPRKFKVGLSCSADCGQAWIQDVGLVARPADRSWALQVIAAGSLGIVPSAGIEIIPDLPADQVVTFVLAAMELFAKHGDRQNRRRARLRHVRQRFGDELFARMLREQFLAQAARSFDRQVPQVALSRTDVHRGGRADIP